MIKVKFVYKESFESKRNVGSEGCLMRVSIPGAEPKNSRKLHPRPFFPNNPSMFLEQICPGQVNPEPHAIDTFIWNSIRYIVRKHNCNSTLFLIVDGTPQRSMLPGPKSSFMQIQQDSSKSLLCH